MLQTINNQRKKEREKETEEKNTRNIELVGFRILCQMLLLRKDIECECVCGDIEKIKYSKRIMGKEEF